MCGRLACSLCPEDIPNACHLIDKNGKQIQPAWVHDSEYTYKPFYNGPPTTIVPVIIYDLKRSNIKNSSETHNHFLVAMKWGFTPSFSVNPQALVHTHNARVENVMNSKLYKSSLVSSGRCIVVAEGFYEWQTKAGSGHKQPYFIYQDPYENEPQTKDNEYKEKYLMKMAGLWTSTKTKSGVQYSCTIFTTEADNSLSWLHHRMPVILNTQGEINDWLDYETVSYSDILSKIKEPFQHRTDKLFMLKHYTVDKNYVNKTGCNEAKCMAKVTVKRPNTLDNWLTPKKKK